MKIYSQSSQAVRKYNLRSHESYTSHMTPVRLWCLEFSPSGFKTPTLRTNFLFLYLLYNFKFCRIELPNTHSVRGLLMSECVKIPNFEEGLLRVIQIREILELTENVVQKPIR